MMAESNDNRDVYEEDKSPTCLPGDDKDQRLGTGDGIKTDQNTSQTQTSTTPPSVTTSQPVTPAQLSIDQQLQKAKRDLENMVLKYAKSEQDNLKNKNKVEDLDKKLKRAIKDNDQLANRIKILTNDKNHLTDTLNAKVAQLTVLEQKKSHMNDVQSVRLKELETRIKELEADNEDLLKQIESYKSKEGELLDFSERLSMKHMLLQTELEEMSRRQPSFKTEYESILEQNSRLEEENQELSIRLESLKVSLDDERRIVSEMKAIQEESELRYMNELDRLENEIKVMRRKHQIASKELLKEVKHLQVELEKAGKPGATNANVVTASS